jgi:DNA-nicking Smr family endonuclease
VARRKPPPRKSRFENRPLKDLKRLKKSMNAPREEQPATPEPTPPAEREEDDGQLFQDAMTGVAPLGTGPVREPVVRKASPQSHEDREAREVMQALRDLVEGEAPLSIHETDEAIEGAVEGLDPRILRKLRRGEFSVQDHIDLHGCTRAEAREKVEAFVLSAIAQGKRCVLVIHGRGYGSKDRIPVLKNALTSWFTRRALRKKILAFTTARPVDGGAGAVYVLLRKYKPPIR